MRTIKVAGISGTGKTTLISEVVRKNPDYRHHCFSSYLEKFGTRAAEESMRDLRSHDGLSLMDEHLEIESVDLRAAYELENTRGVVLLEVSIPRLLAQRRKDAARLRDMDAEAAGREQEVSTARAYALSRSCGVSLLHLRDVNFVTGVEALDAFCRLAGQF